MKYVHLLWAALARHKGRTLFTWLSVVVSFILFSILAAVRYGLLGQLTISVAQRLNTFDRAVQGSPMPLSYYRQIASVPGVSAATYLNGFPGYYQRPRNALQMLGASESVFAVFPEAKLPAGRVRAWRADRQGVIVGPQLAGRYGWKVGETIPVRSRVPQKDGRTTWYFHLDGIYHAKLPDAYQNFFIAHYQYFNQSVADPAEHDVVSQYIERVRDPREAERVSRRIDRLFLHSTPQTFTQSQAQSAMNYVRQFGNVSAIVIYVGIAVFFTLMLIAGNAMSQSARERAKEFAVFRALGFPAAWVMRMILSEALVLLVSGSVAGLAVGWEVTRLLYPGVGSVFQTFQLTWGAVFTGALLSVAFGAGAAVAPMRGIARARITDALRDG